MKKEKKSSLLESMPEEQSPSFSDIESRVFTEYKGSIYLGTEKIKPDVQELLKDQAKWLQSSQLYEILRATIINEAAHLALLQSTEWDHVLSAKMLHHWQYVLDNMLKRLTQ